MLDIEKDEEISIILSRSFLVERRTFIDVQKYQLILRVQDEQVTFNILKALKHPNDGDSCLMIDVIDKYIKKLF